MDGGFAEEKKTGLALLRSPFLPHQISKLPKPTRAQTEAVKKDFRKGIRCKLCGQWHHPDVVHLDYVGHAALTDRLLDVDPHWNWEPTAFDQNGAPMMDANGGMWIKLTVCGVTRLGYGHPDGKKGGDATKEVIGDALRNAAMRFGAALDLWHKGDLHISDDSPDSEVDDDARSAGGNQGQHRPDPAPEAFDPAAVAEKIKARLSEAQSVDDLAKTWRLYGNALKRIRDDAPALYDDVTAAKDEAKRNMEAASKPLLDDEIPY